MLLMLLCDAVLLPLALYSAIALRLGTWIPDVSQYFWIFFVLPFVSIPVFVRIGLYRAIVRFMDDKIILTVFYAVTLSVLILIAVVGLGRADGVPRSSFAIYWIIAIVYIASSRFLARGVLRTLEKTQEKKQPVAIYGAGRAGLQTALALLSGVEFRPVAFFDDDKQLQGTSVLGIRVFSPKNAAEVMREKGCRQLLIAMPSATRVRRREIIQQFEGMNLVLKTLPGMGELVEGKVSINDIRDVGVEDLLGRDPVPPSPELLGSCITGKSVLVTGAGGSIGSELCRQIALNGPSRLILFEQNEFSLYKVEQDLRKHFSGLSIYPVLGDVLNQQHLETIFKRFSVETVYHASAYKHVPLVEANIIAGVKNNAFGTWSAATASINCGVKNFVLISTDKAVRPTNVMGATKRLSELILQALACENQGTRFSMVRFGNVLGSSGSVVPLFREQIRGGGPLTVTHPDVTRYFMTIPEAAQLVLQAGSMGSGGDVFVLDMGEPVRIVDLAKKMIELSGFHVKENGIGDIGIEFVGLRPGEKLYEELLIGAEVEKTTHPRIMRAVEGMVEPSVLFGALGEMQTAFNDANEKQVKDLLKELVVEYVPSVH